MPKPTTTGPVLKDEKPSGLNLDTLEREGDIPDPYVVTVGGKEYRFADPETVSWDDLDKVVSKTDWLTMTIIGGDTPEDREALRTEFGTAIGTLPNWKIARLNAGYQAHYALPSPGESSASSDS